MLNLNTPPLKKSVVGKSSSKTSKKTNVSPCDGSMVVESQQPFCSPPSSKSPCSSTNYLSSSSPSSMSAVSKLSSLSSKYAKDKKKLHLDSTTSPLSMSTTSKSSSPSSTNTKIKKRFFVDDTDHFEKKKYKKSELKLAAYDIDWFDSLAINNGCLKYDIEQNLPGSQEEKLLFLLSQFETSDIKLSFVDAIGKIGKAAETVFYPLPPRKEKLMNGFIELISGESLMMDDCSEDSFR
jgi:hypothetical protein